MPIIAVRHEVMRVFGDHSESDSLLSVMRKRLCFSVCVYLVGPWLL